MSNSLPATISQFVETENYHQLAQDILAQAQLRGATQAEVDLQASIGLNVSVRLGEVETLAFNRDKSLALTVYIGQKKASASTNDLSPASITAMIKAAYELATLTEEDPYAGLAAKAELAQAPPDLDLYHPWELTVAEAIDLAKRCEATALGIDSRINNSEGASVNSGQSYSYYANSNGFSGGYATSRHSLSCCVIAADKGEMEQDADYTLARNKNLLLSPEAVGTEAAHKVLQRLGAVKLPTQRVPVVFQASVAAGLINHFLSAISGGRLFRQSSFLVDSLHSQVFPDYIDIEERPHIRGGLGSFAFDNDGVATRDKAFVKAGRVENYILSAYSARKLNMANTGNAGGTSNIFVKPTAGDLPALLKMMGTGLLVTDLMGPGINLVTGDYSRGAAGFWVEKGQIQYPVHEITIAGNLKTMYQQLLAVGTDVDPRNTIQTGSLLIADLMLAGT